MRTTTGRKTAHRRLRRHPRLGLEPLELRLALSSPASLLIPITPPSSGSLSVVSALPADRSVLSSSPTSLQITFDRQLSSFSLGGDDFELARVAGDGSVTLLQHQGLGLEESLDPDGYQIDLGLTGTLGSGQYEVLLSPDTQLQGIDGSSPAFEGSSPMVVDDFTVSPPESGLGSATDLQALNSNVLTVPGQLNLAADPGAVAYYKFEVAPGHHWLVGLQISGDAGAKIDASLSLFDASGHLISTSSQGLAGSPGNPYLFAGLDAGTYYVGVASSLNIPDASGAYGTTALAGGSTNPGSPFQLQAVADVADQPTQVLGLRLDHADPQSTAPTGLTLEFSGGLAPSSLSSTTSSPLILVDQSGATWSLTPSQYDPGDGQLSLVFDRPLVPGTYMVELAGTDSLLDLAGRTPVADGLSSGVLGTFVVAPTTQAAGDLGTLLPGLGVSGLGSTMKVEPGTPTAESFVIVEPGVYSFKSSTLDGGVQFSVEDGSGNVLLTSTGQEHDLYLAAGSYQVVLTATADRTTGVAFSIIQRLALRSSLLDTGVSQAPALGLRLVTPQANFGQVSIAPTDPTASTGASAGTSGMAGGASSAARSGTFGGGSSGGPGLGVTLSLTTSGNSGVAGLVVGVGPVGRPSSSSNSPSVVGLAGSGLASVASNSAGLSPGLIVAQVPEADGVERLPEVGPGATLESGLLARSPESRREDERSLAEPDWIARLIANALDRLAPPPATSPRASEATEPGPNLAEASPPIVAEPLEGERPIAASVSPPLAVGVVIGAIVIGSRRMYLRKKTALAKPRAKAAGMESILRGPYRRYRAKVHAR